MAGLPPFFQQLVPQPGPTLPAPALQDVLTWLAQLQKAAPRTTDMVPAGQGISVDPEIITGKDISGPAKMVTLPARPEYFPPGVPKMVPLSSQQSQQQGAGGDWTIGKDLSELAKQILSLGIYRPQNPKVAKTGDVLSWAAMFVPGGGEFEGAAKVPLEVSMLKTFIKEAKNWLAGSHSLSGLAERGKFLSDRIKGFFQNISESPTLKKYAAGLEKDVTETTSKLDEALAKKQTEQLGEPGATPTTWNFPGAPVEFKHLQNLIKQAKMWVEGTHGAAENPWQGQELEGGIRRMLRAVFQNRANFPGLEQILPSIEKETTEVLDSLGKAVNERFASLRAAESGAAQGAKDVGGENVQNFIKNLSTHLKSRQNYKKAVEAAEAELRKTGKQGLAEDAIKARNDLLFAGEKAGEEDVANSPLAASLLHEAQMRAMHGQTEIDSPAIRELQAQSATRDPVMKAVINTILNEILRGGGGQF